MALDRGTRERQRKRTFDPMLLHRGDLLEREPQRVHHEHALRDVHRVECVVLERDDEEREEDQEAGSMGVSG